MNRSTATLASLLARAHGSGSLLLSGSLPELREAGVAWQVQRVGEEQRVADGAGLTGWRVGYDSEALRHEMGIAEPNYGPLCADMVLYSGASVGPGLAQPWVEPEIPLILGGDVDPRHVVGHSAEHADLRVLSEAVNEARGALEVVDSVWSSYVFTWEENTADGSSAARVDLEDPVPAGADLATVGVEVREVDAHGNCATYLGDAGASMGHPLGVLRWLTGVLAEEGRLRAGDVVLTGGLTPTPPLAPGAWVTARFDSPGWTGRVEVKR